MSHPLLFRLALLLVFAGASAPASDAGEPNPKPVMKTVSFGYVLLYVKDVPSSLVFYETAFGFTRRFLHESNGYGELETGATRLAFLSLEVAKSVLKQEPVAANPAGAPLAVELAFLTPDVAGVFEQAVKAGAKPFAEPEKKVWGQTTAYVRDPDGHLIEIATPMP